MYDLYSNDIYDEKSSQVDFAEVSSRINKLEKKLQKLKKKKKGCKKGKKKQLKKRIKVLEMEMDELTKFMSYTMHHHSSSQQFPWAQLIENCVPKLLEIFIKSRQRNVVVPADYQHCLPDNNGKQ